MFWLLCRGTVLILLCKQEGLELYEILQGLWGLEPRWSNGALLVPSSPFA